MSTKHPTVVGRVHTPTQHESLMWSLGKLYNNALDQEALAQAKRVLLAAQNRATEGTADDSVPEKLWSLYNKQVEAFGQIQQTHETLFVKCVLL